MELELGAALVPQAARRVWVCEDGASLTPLAPGQAASILELSVADGGAAGDFVTLRAGLGSLVAALATSLDGQVRADTPITAVTRNGAGFRVSAGRGASEEVDAVVLAVPPRAAASLVEGLDAELPGELHACSAASSAAVALAYPRDEVSHPLDGAGFVVPRAAARVVVGCTFASSKFADRAPPGWVLVRAHVGRYGEAGALALDDRALVAAVERELEPVLGITRRASRSWVFRWPHAVPRCESLSRARSERILALAQRCGVGLAGAAYDGVSLAECVAGARRAAGQVLEAVVRPGR